MTLTKIHVSSMNLPLVTGLFAGLGSLYFLYRKRLAWRRKAQYKAGCRQVREKRDQEVEELRKKLSTVQLTDDRVKYITSLSLGELIEQLKTSTLTATEVLHAYQTAALRAHDLTNCLTHVFEDAEQTAKDLDASTDKTRPLHGVPVSIKDNMPSQGHADTKGCLILKDNVPQENALILETLRKQGAIPFVKTNIPQLMMGCESANALYGTTSNPLDTTRSPGGSSGGEGAIIAAGASVIGIGSDIAGSVRIPASACGIYSLKPTSERLSKKGVKPSGQTVVRATWGPMARDVDSLAITMKALLTTHMFDGDTTIPPVPFNSELYDTSRPLTFGYYTELDEQKLTPPVKRAMEVAKKALIEKGHRVVEWKPPNLSEARELFIRALSGDRGSQYREVVKNEERHGSINNLAITFMSDFSRFLVASYLSHVKGDKETALFVRHARGTKSVQHLFNVTAGVKLYIEKFQKSWSESGLDVVICPVMLHPALKLTSSYSVPVNVWHTGLYNLVDYPAGVVPITRIIKQDLEDLTSMANSNSIFQNYLATDLQDSEGLPVCVQCVAPTWRDELCLAAMRELESACNFKMECQKRKA